MSRISVRMRYIVWPADFRTNEVTMMARVPRAVLNEFGANDAVCFISSVGNLVRWVWQSNEVGTIITPGTGETRARRLWTSAQIRLNRGEFSAEMLSTYAKEAGIELAGLRLYREKWEEG